MAKKKKCKKVECPAGEKWAVPTADFFSLLLALFIALYAIASVNKEKMQAIKEEFVKIYDFTAATESVESVDETTPTSKDSEEDTQKQSGKDQSKNEIQDSIAKIQKEIRNATTRGDGPLDQSMDGVLLKLPATILFRGSEATIYDENTFLFIRRIAYLLNSLPDNIDISVRGYTDDLPLRGSTYSDNVELSNKRAFVVMQELIKNGVEPKRLSTAGFGSSKPIADNITEDGRVKNRRVEIYMFISPDIQMDKEKQKSILDSISKLQSN